MNHLNTLTDSAIASEENELMNWTMNRSRKMIKKCRTCHVKRRLCQTNSLSCPALKQECFFCNKRGHYKGSLNCKKRRSNKEKYKAVYNDIKVEDAKNMSIETITEENLFFIKERISEIELSLKLEYEKGQSNNFINKKFVQLIPFLMMFLFLNYDCLALHKPRNFTTNLRVEIRKMQSLTRKIKKLLKFYLKQHQKYRENTQTFTSTFSKKLKKIISKCPLSIPDIKTAIRYAFDSVLNLTSNCLDLNTSRDSMFEHYGDLESISECFAFLKGTSADDLIHIPSINQVSFKSLFIVCLKLCSIKDLDLEQLRTKDNSESLGNDLSPDEVSNLKQIKTYSCILL